MYKTTVNQELNFEIDPNSDLVNSIDFLETQPNSFHAIKNNKGYSLNVLEVDYTKKTALILVNGNKYNVELKDKFDELLEQLGMDKFASDVIKEVKAPMPGLVIDILVDAGTEVLKGDGLIILEAMKMENIIKSPTDGLIKSISIKKGETVEKNEILINFEG